MNDPGQQNSQYITLLAAIIGGVLTILGGFIATIVNSRVLKKSEIEYIKIGLIDELHEICSIIGKMKDTYKTTHIVSNSYLNDLQKNTDSFKYHKQRLFLIRKENLRREIVQFYKDLEENISESINKVGKLGEAQVDNTHDQIVSKFIDIQTAASSIEDKVKNYKYMILWFSSKK